MPTPQGDAGPGRSGLEPRPALGACLVRVGDGEEVTCLVGRLLELSARGCRLALPEGVRAGSAVEVALVRKGGPVAVRALVTHATPEAGEWLLGCAFSRPLDEARRRAWLPG